MPRVLPWPSTQQQNNKALKIFYENELCPKIGCVAIGAIISNTTATEHLRKWGFVIPRMSTLLSDDSWDAGQIGVDIVDENSGRLHNLLDALSLLNY
ncbi:hypothetical protein V1520DRAFT_151858 [Lipomyces starkeyi]